MKKLYIFILIFLISGFRISADTKVIKPNNAKSKVTIIISGKSRSYYSLSAKDPSVISLRGPGKLEVITRAKFDIDRKQPLDYKIFYKIDGGEKIEKDFKKVTKSQISVFKNEIAGFPGNTKRIIIDLSSGEHSVEFWSGNKKPDVFARYMFTLKKGKKIDWIALSPVSPKEPVNLIAGEELVEYYRFSNEKPLRIKITGPTTLKVLTRIENHFDMKGRIYYRLQLKEDGKFKNTYLLNSVRSVTARYKNDGSKVPGKAKEIIIDVGPGSHYYSITPIDKDKNSVLGRVLFPKKDIVLEE